jgi:hypothetical protein
MQGHLRAAFRQMGVKIGASVSDQEALALAEVLSPQNERRPELATRPIAASDKGWWRVGRTPRTRSALAAIVSSQLAI